jgi:hypothetical protein
MEHPSNFHWCILPVNMEIDPPAGRLMRQRIDKLTAGKDQYMLRLMYSTDYALWEDVEIR